MSKKTGTLKPWQIFHAARKHLGPSNIASIFGKSNMRSAYDWAQDPATTKKRCKSPLESLHIMFERLDSIGLGYVARAGIKYLETAIEPSEEHAELQEIKATICEEVLADYSAVGALQKAVQSENADIEEVRAIKQAAVDEIERTYARFMADRKKENAQ